MTDVANLIEKLYEAFVDVPKPIRLEGCALGCCMPKSDEDKLLSQPLRESDPRILWHYVGDAIHLVGDKTAYKYFMPRILELGLTPYIYDGEGHGDAHESNFISCPEIFGLQLQRAEYSEWSVLQRKYLDQAIFMMFRSDIKRMDFFDAAGWLNLMCRINLPSEPYLELMDSAEGQEFSNYFLKREKDSRMQERMTGSFWDDMSDENSAVMHKWLIAKCAQRGAQARRKREKRKTR